MRSSTRISAQKLGMEAGSVALNMYTGMGGMTEVMIFANISMIAEMLMKVWSWLTSVEALAG